jgi:type II restriction/modification system DNA methylase subunit YeeA
MKEKYIHFIILWFKILSVIYLISAIVSFITTIIYNVRNDEEGIIFFIFSNLGVTLFYRIVTAIFFFVFATFFEEWMKTE